MILSGIGTGLGEFALYERSAPISLRVDGEGKRKNDTPGGFFFKLSLPIPMFPLSSLILSSLLCFST